MTPICPQMVQTPKGLVKREYLRKHTPVHVGTPKRPEITLQPMKLDMDEVQGVTNDRPVRAIRKPGWLNGFKT